VASLNIAVFLSQPCRACLCVPFKNPVDQLLLTSSTLGLRVRDRTPAAAWIDQTIAGDLCSCSGSSEVTRMYRAARAAYGNLRYQCLCARTI